MAVPIGFAQTRIRATCVFIDPPPAPLAQLPGTVVDAWPRFRSGAYLVTLAYPQPIQVGQAFITEITAFASELRCDARSLRSYAHLRSLIHTILHCQML